MTGFSEVRRLPEFSRDLKRLSKRFRTLEDDLQILISAQLFPFHKLGLDNRGTVRIPDLGFPEPPIFKTRKFASRSLPGKGAQSGLRLIHAFFEADDRIELVEIYFKGEKENENRERISEHYGN
jgi:hypothetical protein